MKALFCVLFLLLFPALAHADSGVNALSPVTNPIPSGSCMYITPGAGLDAKDCITSPGTAFNYNTIDATQETGLSAATSSATFSGTTMTVNTASVGVFTVGMTVTFSGSAGQTIAQLGTYAGSTGTLILSASASGTAVAASGADTSMCAKISAAATALYGVSTGGGTIDARGFTGTQHCGGSMFTGWPSGTNFVSTVLLGSVMI